MTLGEFREQPSRETGSQDRGNREEARNVVGGLSNANSHSAVPYVCDDLLRVYLFYFRVLVSLTRKAGNRIKRCAIRRDDARAKCNAMGYLIIGVRIGMQSRSGRLLTAQSQKVVDRSPFMTCSQRNAKSLQKRSKLPVALIVCEIARLKRLAFGGCSVLGHRV